MSHSDIIALVAIAAVCVVCVVVVALALHLRAQKRALHEIAHAVTEHGGMLKVICGALGVQVEEVTREIQGERITSPRLRGDPALEEAFGLRAPSSRGLPQHPQHPHAVRPSSRPGYTPPYGDSYPPRSYATPPIHPAHVSVPLGYGTPAPVSQAGALRRSGGPRSGPMSRPLGHGHPSAGPGPNSRGLYQQQHQAGGQR